MEECEVIDECTDEKSPVGMEDCINEEHKDRIRNNLVDKNDTKVNDEVREISIRSKSEDVINRDITDTGTEKIWISIKK